MNQRIDRWRVEPGDAVGVAIRIPAEHVDSMLVLLSPVVNRSMVVSSDNYPVFYVTTGHGILNSQPVVHKFVNIICEPPPSVSVTPALGVVAWGGALNSPPNQLFWRHGYTELHARVSLKVANDYRSARAKITTKGGILQASATFPDRGESWNMLPNNLIGMDVDSPAYSHGDEWGMRYDGTGMVSVQKADGSSINFETYIGLDTHLGWEYIFDLPNNA